VIAEAGDVVVAAAGVAELGVADFPLLSLTSDSPFPVKILKAKSHLLKSQLLALLR
jgi:hypothetical protein